MTLHSCFDFRLRSEFPLPELIPADAPEDTRPIVDIRYGSAPEALPGAPESRFALQVAGEEALLTIPDIARYHVRGDATVTIDPFPGASERNIRLFLLGSTLGIVAARRGLLLLHANAIVIDGRVVAFAGHSGAGKSTLAAWFEREGYEVLTDDVCALRFDAEGRPMAWPGLPRLKLWAEAADQLGLNRTGLDRIKDDLDKYHVPMQPRGAARPIPFGALCVLSRVDEGAPPAIERLRGQAAAGAVMGQTYRGEYLSALGLGTQHFGQAMQLARAAQVYQVPRRWGFDNFDAEAQRIAAFVRDPVDGA